MMNPLLTLRSLSAGYGPITVLHEVSLAVHPGEIVSVIGSNGAGKSTLMRVISGLIRDRGGEISFQGDLLNRIPAAERVNRGVAQVPEGRRVFGKFSVLENLELGAYRFPKKEFFHEDCEKAFSLFPILAERRHQPAGLLSGGEQQMLAIARALMSRPTLLLLDEPSMGVAPKLVAKIFSTILELNQQGMTMLLVEQNAHRALEIAHRGYVLEVGKIILEASGKELLHDPRVKAAYLGD